jgi:hypothetical protein
MRRTVTIALLSALAATALVALPAAHAATQRKCGSIRLNQSLKRDSHGLYGAFGILGKSTTCPTARSLADKWVHNKKAVKSHPWRYHGWACGNRATEYQQFAVICTKKGARVTFKAELPGG